MALTTCSECGKPVSSSAASCPNCGFPLRPQPLSTQAPGQRIPVVHGVGGSCPFCGSNQVGKVRGLQGPAEVLAAAFLTLLCLIPGIVYYIYIESVPYCSGCGRRVRR